MKILSLFNDINNEEVNNKEVDDDFELDDVNNLFDYLDEVDSIKEYLKILDNDILTEENLNDDQIINLIQNENEEINRSDNDDSDKEIPLISIKNGMEGLKMFIDYFEQQNDLTFDLKDLSIFRKYLQIIKTKEFNSRNQSKLDQFFN